MKRLLFFPLVTTRDARMVLRSRLIWGTRIGNDGQPRFVLTPLGLANTARQKLGRDPWRVNHDVR